MKLLYILMAVCLSCPLFAAPITVGPGETATFNFNAGGPVPTLSSIGFFQIVTNSTFPDGPTPSGSWSFFNDLNASGGSFFGGDRPLDLGSRSRNLSFDPGVQDGIFSLTVSNTDPNNSLITNPIASYIDRELVSNQFIFTTLLEFGPIREEAMGSSVPAPTTLALFGLGLAGLGYSRRKKA